MTRTKPSTIQTLTIIIEDVCYRAHTLLQKEQAELQI